MESKIINLVKYVSLTSFTFGILIFLFGLLESAYKTMVPIGIGLCIGSVFIFIIGIFFVLTEETLEKMYFRDMEVSMIKKEYPFNTIK